jgi:hypothetical protein
MPDICIITQFMEPSDQSGKVKLTGQAIENVGNTLIGWECHCSYNSEPSEINTAVIKAAIAEFGRVDPPINVIANDKKTLFSAAT